MPRPGPSAAETPLLKVARPVSACSKCRSAKIKCDGKLPACTACVKSGRAGECSSANDQFARGKERSYVASLESRLEKLEKRLVHAKSREASVPIHNGAANLPKPPSQHEAADIDELVSDLGFLSINATTRDFEASTTSMTFARLTLAATINDPLPESTMLRLPPRSTAMALIQYYVENIFALFPVFHETALLNALDAIYQEHGRPVTEFEYWLLYMVFAIAKSAQSRSRRDIFFVDGLNWAGHALQYADVVLMPGYVSQIQALVLLVQYSMLDPAHFDSWQLIGITCRAVVDLGFHQDPPKERQTDKTMLEIRRKIFFCVYSLDRSISLVYARPFSFTDDATSVALPSLAYAPVSSVSTRPLTGPHPLETASLLFRLRKLQSSWYQELFQSSRNPLQDSSAYVWDLCQKMLEWSDSFPNTLPLAFKDFFDLELLYSYVYCLAPSCRVQVVSSHSRTQIFEYSLAYMQKIFPISSDPVNKAFYTYHDALRVFFVGSQFVAMVTDDQDQRLQNISSSAAGSPPQAPGLRNFTTMNIDASINCITHVKETLKIFGYRWDNAKSLLVNFEGQSKPLLLALQETKKLRETDKNRLAQFVK